MLPAVLALLAVLAPSPVAEGDNHGAYVHRSHNHSRWNEFPLVATSLLTHNLANAACNLPTLLHSAVCGTAGAPPRVPVELEALR